jgi:hypothetical protein
MANAVNASTSAMFVFPKVNNYLNKALLSFIIEKKKLIVNFESSEIKFN